MSANLKNTAVATGLEKVSFHSNPKEGQCQRMFQLPDSCSHFPCSKVMLKILHSRLQLYMYKELTDDKLGLEKAEEPDIKLPISVGS